jgi:AcrR family transcriptional regulator
MTNDLTQKGRHTRQHILATAVRLFMTQGYDATTMRDIAAAAECSPGLTYRYFAQKEALVVALYEDLATESLVFADSLAFMNMAERYHMLMQHKMAQVKPHRAALMALFCAVMQPDANTTLNIWGRNTTDSRDKMLDVFGHVVNGATDKLNEPVASSMITLLYAFYILLMIFWSYDRTPDFRATRLMLDFMREALKIVRPMMLMPVISKAVVRLAGILALVFVNPPETSSQNENRHDASKASPERLDGNPILPTERSNNGTPPPPPGMIPLDNIVPAVPSGDTNSPDAAKSEASLDGDDTKKPRSKKPR